MSLRCLSSWKSRKGRTQKKDQKPVEHRSDFHGKRCREQVFSLSQRWRRENRMNTMNIFSRDLDLYLWRIWLLMVWKKSETVEGCHRIIRVLFLLRDLSSEGVIKETGKRRNSWKTKSLGRDRETASIPEQKVWVRQSRDKYFKGRT